MWLKFEGFGREVVCTACREEVSLKRSIITNHIASVKHKQTKVKLAMMKESREKDIAEALVAYDEQEHPRGETLSADQRVYGVKIVTAFLKLVCPWQSWTTFVISSRKMLIGSLTEGE